MDTYSGKVAITFHSHYDATRQKRAFKGGGVDASLVPVPRSLSSSCGSALLVEEKDFDAGLLIKDIEEVYVYKEDKWSVLPRQ